MSRVKVSFIVPIYDVVQFLPCCLDSLINQTMQDIEIICINDCSPDNSQAVLKSYAAKDPRIKLIDFKENKGPGAARNAGLDAVTGKFIRMVDADDFIPPDSTEKLLEAAEQYKSNYIRGGFRNCSASDKILGKGWNHPRELTVNTIITKEKRLWRFDQHWAYLYRTKALLNSGARYDESMRNGQDAAFLVDLMPHLKRVTFIPETVYYYRENPTSIMRRKREKMFYLNVLGLYPKAYKRLGSIDMREAADYIFYLALCYYLPDKILSSIPENLDHDDGIEILRYFNMILTEQNSKDLCFDRPYPWQQKQQMPWQSKYLILLLSGGHLDDAYNDLKVIKQSKIHEQGLIEKKRTFENELKAVYSSSSWKVTALLRKLGTIIHQKERSKGEYKC